MIKKKFQHKHHLLNIRSMLYNLFEISHGHCERLLANTQLPGKYVARPWQSTACAGHDTESWHYWRIDVDSDDPVLRSANASVEYTEVQHMINDHITRYIWTATLLGIQGFLLHQPGTHSTGKVRWAHPECLKKHDYQEYVVITAMSAHALGLRINANGTEQVLELKQGECVLMPAEYTVSQRLETENTLFYVMTFEIFDPNTQTHGLILELESHEIREQADKGTTVGKRRPARKKQQATA